MRVRSFAVSSLFLATLAGAASLACGASRAAAEPQPTAPHHLAALVPGDVTDDTAVARAIREHYTKYEFRIPMRDGARLFTAVYVPKDRSRSYPMLLTRTPYSVKPYGVDNLPTMKAPRAVRRFAPSPTFVKNGYIFVQQDVRGRMMSEGTFVDVRPAAKGAVKVDESTDAWDTVDWLVKNVPANNGRVGVWGISYPGFYAAQAAVSAHPAVKAVSPQAPVTEWFLGDDFHHNGAFFLADAFEFYSSFGKARPEPTKKLKWGFDKDRADVYDFFLAMGPVANADKRYLKGKIAFWNDLMAHGTRDAFWRARDPRPRYKDAKPAILTVGGWFDAEDLFGTLATYRAFEQQSPKSHENTLVMGPWRHGGWHRTDGDRLGDVSFGVKTSRVFQDQIELPFFERHLRPDSAPKAPAQPEAFVFETGTNTWQRYPSWPPPGAASKEIFFHAGGALSARAPVAREDEAGADAYVSDPAKPVPYRAELSSRIDEDYMTADQRFAARRPDVLVYASPALEADVTLAGPLEATLWVSTTGTDADFVVKLVDVYPEDVEAPDPNPRGVTMGGYQQLVRAEIMRGKFRSSFEKPAPFEPGKPTLVRFSLPDVCHTFRTGHKLMVQIQSSWFPLVDRNPQTFTDIYRATDQDFHAQTHRIYRTPEHPSGLKVTVARGSLPAP